MIGPLKVAFVKSAGIFPPETGAVPHSAQFRHLIHWKIVRITLAQQSTPGRRSIGIILQEEGDYQQHIFPCRRSLILSPAKFAAGKRLRFDRARGCFVVLGPERVLMPDPTGVDILKRCDGERTAGATGDDPATHHSAPRAVVAADVLAFLQRLTDDGWIRV